MALNRKDFSQDFRNSLPSWTCSVCQNGSLVHIEKTEHVIETGPSINIHSEDWWGPDMREFRFTQMFECSNKKCKDIATVCGEVRTDVYQTPPVGDYVEDKIYIPLFVNPPPLVFGLPDELSEKIRFMIQKSFQMFWSDIDACANQIRKVVEEILSDQKVPRSRRAEGKLQRIPLHDRIDAYQKLNHQISEFFMALKWVGNARSHSSRREVSRDEALSAFEFLESIIEKLYVGTEARLSKSVKKINKNKGPVKKSAKEKKK
jgi:hypothetical protein